MNDENGKTRVRLGVTKDGAALGLFEAAGEPGVGLGVSKEGKWLMLGDDGDPVVFLDTFDERPSLGIRHEKGKGLVDIFAENKRLTRELAGLQAQLAGLQMQLEYVTTTRSRKQPEEDREIVLKLDRQDASWHVPDWVRDYERDRRRMEPLGHTMREWREDEQRRKFRHTVERGFGKMEDALRDLERDNWP